MSALLRVCFPLELLELFVDGLIAGALRRVEASRVGWLLGLVELLAILAGWALGTLIHLPAVRLFGDLIPLDSCNEATDTR